MKVLVTGASGLIGASLVRELLTAGCHVRALVRPTSDPRALAGLPVEIVHGDILSPDSLAAAAADCELLFHTAAIFAYQGHTDRQLESVAVDGTINALEAARRAGVRRVTLTSSSVTLGSAATRTIRDENDTLTGAPDSAYAAAKVRQEQAAFARAAELGLDLVVVCPTITVGPHDFRLSPSNGAIMTYLADPFRITFPGGCNVVAARDVARGHLLAAARGETGQRYVLGGENLEWIDIHRLIARLCGVPGPLSFTNHTGAYLTAAAHELVSWLGRRPPTTTRTQARMVGRYYWYRHERAAALGYAPAPAREALATAVAWLAASPHVSRALRATLRLSREVYDARRKMEQAEAALRGRPVAGGR
ncbi:MAG: NAD-dependent epimerase/dehydratase family protein [Blastocatellia bacterium]